MKVRGNVTEAEMEELRRLAEEERRPLDDQVGYLVSIALKQLQDRQAREGRNDERRSSAR